MLLVRAQLFLRGQPVTPQMALLLFDHMFFCLSLVATRNRSRVRTERGWVVAAAIDKNHPLSFFVECRYRRLARLRRSNACCRFLSVVFPLVQLQLQTLRFPECGSSRAGSGMAATAGAGVVLRLRGADILCSVQGGVEEGREAEDRERAACLD